MRILHTADWHLGQLFHNYDRFPEHQAFLDWLLHYLMDQSIDVLLVSGDVFDTANPSAQSIRQLYSFIGQLSTKCPQVQVVMTAGNHDSANRIEAAQPLVDAQRVHLIGTITRTVDGTIDYSKICIPLYNARQEVAWICLAIPYLRMGDYPLSGVSYAEGITAFYQEAAAYAKTNFPDVPLLAMGHLHALEAEVTDLDKSERQIMGGLEYIPTHAFDPALQYVALGHIHKAQWIGPNQRIRYSGSPLPLSFTEQSYRHQIMLIEVDEKQVVQTSSIEIPQNVKLLRIPEKPAILEDVLQLIASTPAAEDKLPPFVSIQVLLEQPQPQLRYQIERAIQDKNWRLAQISTSYVQRSAQSSLVQKTRKSLDDLHPMDVVQAHYIRKYQEELPEELSSRFQICLNAVTEGE